MSLTFEALAATGKEITRQEVLDDWAVIAEFLDYLRWLADQDTGIKLTAGDVWELYYEGVRVGRVWSDVCEDIGLPVREVW
jgi:hypothetical protein